MDKTTKYILIWGGIYLGFVGLIAFAIYSFKWDWKLMWWFTLVPLVFGGVAFAAIKLFKKKTPKLNPEEEVPDINIDIQKDFIKKWILANEDHPVDIPIIRFINSYTPKQQEGQKKISYYKMKIIGYWGEQYGGFDTLFVALDKKKPKIIMWQTYQKRDEANAELLFDEKLNYAVENPEKTIEISTIVEDPMSGSQRTITKKAPAEYLHQQEKINKEREEAEKEGVDK